MPGGVGVVLGLSVGFWPCPACQGLSTGQRGPPDPQGPQPLPTSARFLSVPRENGFLCPRVYYKTFQVKHRPKWINSMNRVLKKRG